LAGISVPNILFWNTETAALGVYLRIFRQGMYLFPRWRSRPVALRPYLTAVARDPRERKVEEKGITQMNATRRIIHGRSMLSVREAAWALGVDQSVVCRAIRRDVLPLVKRRGRAVVPAAAVIRLLCHVRVREARDGGDAGGRQGHADRQPAGGGAP
jgi:hypothetical protein